MSVPLIRSNSSGLSKSDSELLKSLYNHFQTDHGVERTPWSHLTCLVPQAEEEIQKQRNQSLANAIPRIWPRSTCKLFMGSALLSIRKISLFEPLRCYPDTNIPLLMPLLKERFARAGLRSSKWWADQRNQTPLCRLSRKNRCSQYQEVPTTQLIRVSTKAWNSCLGNLIKNKLSAHAAHPTIAIETQGLGCKCASRWSGWAGACSRRLRRRTFLFLDSRSSIRVPCKICGNIVDIKKCMQIDGFQTLCIWLFPFNPCPEGKVWLEVWFGGMIRGYDSGYDSRVWFAGMDRGPENIHIQHWPGIEPWA